MEPGDSKPCQDGEGFPPIPEVASNFELDWRWRFAHGMNGWALENRITARELAMLRVMDRITDKPGWETQIFDEEIAASWKTEAVASELLLSQRAWDWCLKELRDKAGEFAQTGRVAVYDAGPRVVKSRLNCGRLKALVQEFIHSADDDDGCQLDQDGQVLNIIDPSLYPLAYGVTEVLPDGEEVDPDDLWEKMNQGCRSVAAPDVVEDIFRQAGQDMERAPDILRDPHRPAFTAPLPGNMWHPRQDERWWRDGPWKYSTRFQWLPCDVKFADPDSDDGCKVRLDGYISNLHPSSHRPLYSAIEDAISASIGPWNNTVTYAIPESNSGLIAGLGRASPRIRAFNIAPMLPISPNGICWREEGNFYKDLMDLSGNWETLDPAVREASLDSVIARMDAAENHASPGRNWGISLLQGYPTSAPGLRSQDCHGIRQHHRDIQTRLEKFLHKEPGAYYSFEDWKAGKIPPKPIHPELRDHNDPPSSEDESEEAIQLKRQRKLDNADRFGCYPEGTLSVGDEADAQREADRRATKLRALCPHCPCYPSDNMGLTFFSRKTAKREEGYDTEEEYTHEYRHAELQQDFRQRGLQVYVKIQGVELTPERPRYEGGNWVLEGLLNEHVVASSICFFNVENVADGGVSVSFRVPANIHDERPLRADPDPRRRMVAMYALDDAVNGKIPPWQSLGSVSAREGRVVSFPNTLQYRIGPAELRDQSKSGHVRFLTLCLADPNYHVVSTKRVVPQRFDWWEQEVFPWAFLMGKGLPDTVVRMIAEEARGGHVVTREEARVFRKRMVLQSETMMAELNSQANYHKLYEPSGWDSTSQSRWLG